MSITFIKHIYKPKTNSCVISQKVESTSSTETKVYGLFSVIGRATCGGRFYSESFDDYKKAYQLFSLYKDVVKYFGGGEVELICVSKEGYDIVDISRI